MSSIQKPLIIKGLTLFIEKDISNKKLMSKIQIFREQAIKVFTELGIEILSFEFGFPPLSPDIEEDELLKLVESLEHTRNLCHFDNFTLVETKTRGKELSIFSGRLLGRILKNFPNLFIGVNYDNREVSSADSQALARNILELYNFDQSEILNYRFAALVNSPAYVPMPASAYSKGKGVEKFSLIIDYSKYLHNILKDNSSSNKVEFIKSSLNAHFEQIQAAAQLIEKETGIKYEGIDTSLVPLKGGGSVGAIVEQLIAPLHFGQNGTVFATSLLANILETLEVKRTGLGAIVYSVLEDDLLAEYNNQGVISVNDLITYAVVGGIGLNMLPVEENTRHEDLIMTIESLLVISAQTRRPMILRVIPLGNGKKDYDWLNKYGLLNTQNMKL